MVLIVAVFILGLAVIGELDGTFNPTVFEMAVVAVLLGILVVLDDIRKGMYS